MHITIEVESKIPKHETENFVKEICEENKK